MIEGTPSSADLARAIIATCIAGRETPAEVRHAVTGAFERLNRTMSEIIGVLGFRAVMARATQVARRELPALEVFPLELPAMAVEPDPAEIPIILASALAILEHLINLLCTFICQELTFRLLVQVWPDLPAAASHRSPDKE